MFGRIIIRFRYFLMACVVGMTAYSLWLLPGLDINQNFAHYFPERDGDLAFYRQMTAQLGDEDDLIAVALRRRAGIFDSVFLSKIHQFTLQSAGLPYVLSAQSLTTIQAPARTPFGIVSRPFIHIDQPSFYPADSLRIRQDERLMRRLISKDLTALVVTLQIEQNLSARQGELLIDRLECLIHETDVVDEAHIAGRKYFEVSYNRISNKELIRGVLLGLAIIALFLGWMYRSLWGVALPMAVFSLSMINFFGYCVLTNRALDATSNLFPTIILISGLSDCIHLFSNYEDKLKELIRPPEAMIQALNEVGLATFITAATTAIGFLTFAISPIPAIRLFGLDVAFGVLLTYLITHIIAPAVLVIIKREAIRTKPDFNRWWASVAEWLYYVAMHRRRFVAGVAGALLLLSVGGIFLINTNNLIVNALPKDHTIRKTARFFEEQLSGVRTLEVAILPAAGRKLSETEILNEIEKLHNHIKSLPSVNGVYSPVTYFKSLNQSWFGGNPAAYRLPESQELLIRQQRLAEKWKGAAFQNLLNEEQTWGKISARMADPGRMRVVDFNDNLNSWIKQNTDASMVHFHITGATLMTDKVHAYSLDNLRNGLLLDALAIGLLIALALRSWRMVFITLAVNIYPLFLAAALMGITGIEMRFTTSIIFIIGLVIAADDTTHFLSKYMIARLRGIPVPEAVRGTLRETGRPVVITFGVLFLGFAILIFSDFRDGQAVGLLVSFLLLCGVLADLFLLPLMLLRNRHEADR